MLFKQMSILYLLFFKVFFISTKKDLISFQVCCIIVVGDKDDTVVF